MSPTDWPTTSRPAGAGGIEARPGNTCWPRRRGRRWQEDRSSSGMSADARRTECRCRCAYAHAMSETARFQQRTASVGMKVDVNNIADTFELLDSYDTETAR